MTTSLYDASALYEQKRRESDVIYLALTTKDTVVLDTLLSEISTLNKKLGKMSSRYEENIKRVIQGDLRVSKHAMLFFGLHYETKRRQLVQGSHWLPYFQR